MSSAHWRGLGAPGEHPALQEREKVHVSSLECSGALGSNVGFGLVLQEGRNFLSYLHAFALEGSGAFRSTRDLGCILGGA